MRKLLSVSGLVLAVVATRAWAQQEQAPAVAAGGQTALEKGPASASAKAPANSSGNMRAESPAMSLDSSPSSLNGDASDSTPAKSTNSSLYNVPAASAGAPSRSTPPGSGFLPPQADSTQPYPPTWNPGATHSAAAPGRAAGKTYYYVEGVGPKEVSQEEIKSAAEFKQLIQSLRAAKTDDEKEDIRKQLNTVVSSELDRDLEEREKRLSEIEAKAKQLREQLQQRKQNKAELQKMLVLLAESPESGLGLPPMWMNAINPTPAYPVYQPYAAPVYNTLPQYNSFPAPQPYGAPTATTSQYVPNPYAPTAYAAPNANPPSNR